MTIVPLSELFRNHTLMFTHKIFRSCLTSTNALEDKILLTTRV